MSDGVITRIRGDRDDVFSRGFICPKGSTLRHLHDDPDRLRTPQLRTSTGHHDATWDDAFAEIDRRLMPIIAEHGPELGRRVSREPQRAQPVRVVLAPAVPPRARVAQHLQRVDGRPDASPRVVGPDVRRPVRDRRPRPRSNRLPADPRRQPVRVERIARHRARLAGPPAGHPAARRTGRRRRSAAHAHRRGRRRAPVHPTGFGRLVPRRARQRDRQRGAGRPRRRRTASQRPRRGAGRGVGPHPRRSERTDGHRGRDDPPHRTRARRRRLGCRLRSGRSAHRRGRHGRVMGVRRAEHDHRQPGSARRRDVGPPGARSPEATGRRRTGIPDRTVGEPRLATSGGQRRASRRDPRRRDRDRRP